MHMKGRKQLYGAGSLLPPIRVLWTKLSWLEQQILLPTGPFTSLRSSISYINLV